MGGCTSDKMCNDGKACTVDVCDKGACTFTPAPVGAPCGDADLCNGDETCDAAGQCQAGTPKAVDDGDICTVDACDPASGLVSHAGDDACLSWQPISTVGAPSPRSRHSTVWTGSKMIVWGGGISGSPFVTDTGAIYDPATDTWAPMSTLNAPSPRESHSAVWTGSKMLVWGGYDDVGYAVAGGIYDPVSDTWTAMSTAGQPGGRVLQSTVWTGKKMLVWGGFFGQGPVGSGGAYDPATDKWTLIPSAGAPSPRFGQSGTWLHDRMIVWGGQNTFDWLSDGKVYLADLGTAGAWMGSTSSVNEPAIREAHSAVWTGNRLLIWGGWNGGPFLDTGSLLDPATGIPGTWTTMSQVGAPAARRDHTAVWTGKDMIVWGGCGEDGCAKYYGDGGRYQPDFGAGTWTPVPEVPTLSPRKYHGMVWTGTEIIVWGGEAQTKLGDGARVVP